MVTKYNNEFQDLQEFTLKQETEHFCEKKFISIFKMLFTTVSLIKKNGVFNLDLKS